MIRSLRRTHPSYELLSRAADRELPPVQAMEINAHLAECRECRQEVDFMIGLRRRFRALTGPELPGSLLPEILERRAAGERRILDAGEAWDEEEALGRVRPAVPAAAAVVTLAVGFGLFAASGIDAGGSRLSADLSPSGVVEGFTVESSGLPGTAELVLRSEYQVRADPPWEETVPAVVQRSADRANAREFRSRDGLPESVVYARVSAETPDGTMVPLLEGTEYLATGPDGSPTFAALLHKLRTDIEVENYPSAVATGLDLTTRFSHNPVAWYWRLVAEQRLGVEDATVHAERFRDFATSLRSDASPDEIAELIYYGATLGWDVEEVVLALRQRLADLAPGHPVALQWSAITLAGTRDFHGLEALWARHGSVGFHTSYASFLDLAVRLGAEDVALRWYDRWIAARPSARIEAAEFLAGLPGSSPQVLARIRETLRRIEAGMVPRPVDRSPAEHRRELDRARRDLSFALATWLAADGQHRAAFDAVSWAGTLAWRTEEIRLLAELATRVGRSEQAIEFHLFGRAMSGLAPDEALRHESALQELGVGAVELQARVSEVRDRLKRRMLAEMDPGLLPTTVSVVSSNGRALDLRSRLAPVTIVLFGADREEETRGAVRRTLDRCAELDARRVGVLLVSDVPPETAPPTSPCATEWLYDRDREARTALGARRFRQLAVIDRTGAVRFRTSSPDDAILAAFLLSDFRTGLSPEPN